MLLVTGKLKVLNYLLFYECLIVSLLRWIEKGALAAAVHKEHWLAAACLLFVRSGGTMVLSLKVKGPEALQKKIV